MKKLCSLKLLQGLQNLEEIDVSLCEKMEQIIESEEQGENNRGEGRATSITFILPKLRKLSLFKLPELKSICGFGLMIPTNSLQYLEVMECRKLKRIPLSLPLLENELPSPPTPPVEQIVLYPEEWWESLEWDDPNVKEMLLPFHLAEHSFSSGMEILERVKTI